MTNRAGKKKSARARPEPRRPRCKACGKPIYMPKGWGVGPSVRRHYWAKHPERMRRAQGE